MERQVWVVRTVLSQLGRQEAAGEEAPTGIAGEFARLKSQSNKYRTDRTFPTRTAEKQDNVKRNRYKDIVPFDHSRVKLTLTTSKNDTDYINASFIEGVSGSRAYIATQGPLPHTTVDFLRMLWEYNVKVVVMACREFEMGKKKCECYWPQKQGQPFVCEPFRVYCDSEENRGDYLTRTLRLNYLSHSRTLKQLHYVSWPDHGVPDSIPPILEMLEEMHTHQGREDVPICIHCSAGCGRTGALCVIDYTWDLLKKQMITPDFKIFDLVQNMRTQRPSLVQTKEQYELVYRTIQLLFDRYLQSVDGLSHRSEPTAVSSAATPGTESENEELNLTPQFQHLLDEERHVLRQNHAENFAAPEAKEQQLQSLPDAQTLDRGLQRGSGTSPALVHTSQRAPDEEEEGMQETGDKPSLGPPPLPAVAAPICLTVEDPYFDFPMSSPSSEEAPKDSSKYAKDWAVSPAFSTSSVSLSEPTEEPNPPASDEEAAPPLPQRTPESYFLAEDAEGPDPYDRLTVIAPPTAAGDAVRELGGSPPSPVPPLPERTPESFELAVDPAPEGQRLKVAPAAVNLNRIGTSSEWAGNSKPAAMAAGHEVKRWARSKSLKAKMTFGGPLPDLPSNAASPLHPPQDPLPPPPPQPEESPTPPFPDGTPESLILTPKEEEEEKEEEESEFHRQASVRSQPPESTRPSTRAGLSSEWDGASQTKKFLDAVKMRSKSVRARSSNQAAEPLTAVQLFTPPPLVVAEGGSAQVPVNWKPPVNAEASGNKSEKHMTRTKSLMFFRHKPKTKITPPPPPASAPTNDTSSSVFKFGFGRRFRKPKGPRSYPETWV